jgi:hypothetical protein
MKPKKLGAETPRVEDLVIYELAKQRLDKMMRNNQVNYGPFDQVIRDVLEGLGIEIKSVDSFPLFTQIWEHLGLSMEALGNLPMIEERLDGDSDVVLLEWAGADPQLEILHMGNYAKIGTMQTQSHMRKGRSVPASFAVLLQFESEPLFLFFEYHSVISRWDVTARGNGANDFMKALFKKIGEYFNRMYKGKELDEDLRPLVLKKRLRADLIYSPQMAVDIDKLRRVFQSWQTSPYIHQWCYLLTGDVGCGKTTVGGLLTSAKNPECTVLYCHASELDQSDGIARVFRDAQMLSPTLLIIDDLHLMFQSEYRSATQATGALMDCLDSLREKNAKVFILLTANNAELLDPALQNRPGRISCKVVFDDYGECLPDLVLLNSRQVGLSLGQEDIEQAVGLLAEGHKTLTPDEVKNVCDSLHLLYGSEPIAPQMLADAIVTVYEAYHIHREKAARSEVAIAKKKGEGDEVF